VENVAILAIFEAKAGKEADLEEYLKSAWYALKLGPGRFGIFDTFPDDAGRKAHLSGAIAKALFARADELLAKPPQIDMPEILAAKPSGA
jgi:quinol monooxygenase YgiN